MSPNHSLAQVQQLKDQEQGGSRLNKAPYDMFGVRVSCTGVSGWVGAVTGQAGGRLEFQYPPTPTVLKHAAVRRRVPQYAAAIQKFASACAYAPTFPSQKPELTVPVDFLANIVIPDAYS